MNSASGDLTAKMVTGTAWSGLAQTGKQVIGVLSTAVLAHLLSPDTYGLLGMALIVVGFIDIFKDLGTGSALIQRAELDDRLVSSVFWMNLLLGVVAAAASFIIAPWMARFFGEPRVAPVLSALSVSFVISSLSIVQQSLLTRDMAFDRLARIELIATTLAACVGVGIAFYGGGVWSLVAMTIVGSALSTIFLWVQSSWRPPWRFAWSDIRSMRSYSLNLVGFNIFNYFARNADNLLIGRYLGVSALGYYSLAYNLMLFPIQNIVRVVGRVLFPAFSRVQHDNVRFRRGYVRICTIIAAVTFPLMMAMTVVADPMIAVLFGTQWMPSATLVMILAPLGMIQSLGTTVGDIYTAKGRTDWMFRWGLVAGSAVIVSFLVGLNWGVIGVATAYAVTSGILLFYPNFAIPFKLIDLPISEWLKALWPGFKYTIAMVAVMLLVRFGLDQIRMNIPLVVLISSGVTGSLLYLGLMIAFKPPVVHDLVSLLPQGRLPLLKRIMMQLGLQ